MNQRRRLLLAGAMAWPLTARTHGPVKRIGVVIPLAENDAEAQREFTSFREELTRLGWRAPRDVQIDQRWSSDPARIPSLAKEIVAFKPDVILSRATPPTKALLQETRAIPIIFVVVADPVGDGVVATLARPGANVTGFTNVEGSLGGKWLELLREMAPRIVRVAAIYNPKTAPGGGAYYWRLVEQAAAATRLQVDAITVADAAGTEHAIDALGREPNRGLLVMPDISNVRHRKVIIAAAERHRLPAIYPIPTFTTDGGLVSYGVDIPDLYRRAAGYVDRILKGAKPGELPVQAPSKFQLTVNLRAAKAIGLEIPRALLLRADSVLQ